MFDITTSRDFLEKLEADFDDFMKEPNAARLALNCALTAYHLHEWVWGDWLKTDYATWKTLRIRDKDSFLAWIDTACPWFSTIQELANGTKHFGPAPSFSTEFVVSPPYTLGGRRPNGMKALRSRMSPTAAKDIYCSTTEPAAGSTDGKPLTP
jgi:hypothetical protein